MDALIAFHASQPFWIWLALGVILLAVEAAFSTEWLLWPAVAAGVVAVVTALGLPLGGFLGEAALFEVFSVIGTGVSRRRDLRVDLADTPVIYARGGRLVGQRARVVESFVDGRGGVFVSGAE